MAGKVILKIIAGSLKGKEFVFDEHDTLLFGRAHDCHVQFPADDKAASRHHFLLEANPPDVLLRDLGSRNGTFVNDVKYGGREREETAEDADKQRFSEVNLKNGDRIKVGSTVFQVVVENQPVSDEADFLTEPSFVRCSSCGRDITDEVSGRDGDFICEYCQAKATVDPAAFLIKELTARGKENAGVDIEGYEIGAKLGEGGMGAVYLGRNKQTNQTAAIKIMLAKVAVNDYNRKTFEREMEVTEDLNHPNIVRFYERGSAGIGFYFVLEYCPGGSLWDLVKRKGGGMEVEEAAPLMLQILDGLAHAHSQGYVHRDLKPQNILLTEPAGGTAKISDFGLAKSFQKAGLSGMTVTGRRGGSLAFMSRDQLINFKKTKPVSDVWSIAATFYYVLTGHPTRDFKQGQGPTDAILHNPVVPIRQRAARIPENVAAIIDRALSDKVEERYQNAGEFRSALASVLQEIV